MPGPRPWSLCPRRSSYEAPGDPELAAQVVELLRARDIPCGTDDSRGRDHGVFVPAMLMAPEATTPVVALSLVAGLDPGLHVSIGEALAPLRDQGVLIVGSGLSYHNMRGFFSHGAARRPHVAHSRAFDAWLVETLTEDQGGGKAEETRTPVGAEERRLRMLAWREAPSAKECHPPGRPPCTMRHAPWNLPPHTPAS